MGAQLSAAPSGGDLSIDKLTYPEELFYGPRDRGWFAGPYPAGPLPCLRCGALVPVNMVMFEMHFHWHKVIEP